MRLSSPIRFFSPSYFGVRKPLHLGELTTFPLVTHSQHWLSKLSTASSWRKIFRIGSLQISERYHLASVHKLSRTLEHIQWQASGSQRESRRRLSSRSKDAQAELQGIRKDQTAHQTARLIDMLICYLHFWHVPLLIPYLFMFHNVSHSFIHIVMFLEFHHAWILYSQNCIYTAQIERVYPLNDGWLKAWFQHVSTVFLCRCFLFPKPIHIDVN